MEQLYVLPVPETPSLYRHSYTRARALALIHIFGCIFFPEVLKHKVFLSSAGLLLTASGERGLETKAGNREVGYSEFLVNLKT